MQSVDALRKLGDVDRVMIEHRVRAMIEYREAGDIGSMLAHVAPDILCHSQGHWSLVLFPRPVVGKASVAEAYRMLNIKYENLGSEVHEFLIDGDRVSLHRTTSVRNRGTSQVFTFDVINFARFRDGLIVEFSEYADVAAREPMLDVNP